MSTTTIRSARLADIEAMQAIEVAADRRFADIGMADLADQAPHRTAVLADSIGRGQAWIALVNEEPAGYAIADVVDGYGHLEQISVHPAYGRQGLGRMLVRTVVDWAISVGLPGLTLLTFRDVPWNGPYYASMGFVPLPDSVLESELMALRMHESELGLDLDARFAMRLDLPVRPSARAGQDQ